METILLKNASWVITDPTNYLIDSSIYIENDLIKAIGPSKKINNKYEKDATVVKDCSGCIVTPGMINSHNHVYEIIQRGLGKTLTMEDWLRYVIYPTDKKLSGEEFYYNALLACMDLVRNGSTSVIDQLTNFARFNADKEMQAFLDFGIRGAVARASSTNSIIDKSENLTPKEELIKCREYIERWKDNKLVEPWLAPAGLYSCDPETLTKLKELANEYNMRFHIHLSETKFQQTLAQKAGYCGQVEWAYKIGILDEKTSAPHCVWITDLEIDLLQKTGTMAVHNPTSNQILGSGFAPVPKMREKGVVVALGSDGPASNDSQDMITEMKAAVLLHRVNTLNPQILNASDGFEMATVQGAKVLGKDNLGTLKVNNLADIACFKVSNNPSLQPVYNPIDALVFYGSGRDNILTLVNGKILYDNGIFPTVKAEEVYTAVEASRKKIAKILKI